MKVRTILTASLMFIFVVGYAGAEKMTPLLPEEKVSAMKKMMTEMTPDTLEASIERGKKLFNDVKLGNNSIGASCDTCHPNGGTSKGAAAME